MAWYSLTTVNLITDLCLHTPVSQVWLIDDAATAGKIKSLHQWYVRLPSFLFCKCFSSWLIIKIDYFAKISKTVFDDSVNVTTEGKRHLGAAIGSENYKRVYCNEIAFTKGFRSKFTYIMRTIENVEQSINPAKDNLFEIFIPTLMRLYYTTATEAWMFRNTKFSSRGQFSTPVLETSH